MTEKWCYENGDYLQKTRRDPGPQGRQLMFTQWVTKGAILNIPPKELLIQVLPRPLMSKKIHFCRTKNIKKEEKKSEPPNLRNTLCWDPQAHPHPSLPSSPCLSGFYSRSHSFVPLLCCSPEWAFFRVYPWCFFKCFLRWHSLWNW